jgi:hypothetical protein
MGPLKNALACADAVLVHVRLPCAAHSAHASALHAVRSIFYMPKFERIRSITCQY